MLGLEDILDDKNLLATLASEYDALKCSNKRIDYRQWIKQRLQDASIGDRSSQHTETLHRSYTDHDDVSRAALDQLKHAKAPTAHAKHTPERISRPSYHHMSTLYADKHVLAESTPKFQPTVFRAPASNDSHTLPRHWKHQESTHDLQFSRPGAHPLPSVYEPPAGHRRDLPSQFHTHPPEASFSHASAHHERQAKDSLGCPLQAQAGQRPAWVNKAMLQNTLKSSGSPTAVHDALGVSRTLTHMQAAARQQLRQTGATRAPPSHSLGGDMSTVLKMTHDLSEQNASIKDILDAQSARLDSQQHCLTMLSKAQHAQAPRRKKVADHVESGVPQPVKAEASTPLKAASQRPHWNHTATRSPLHTPLPDQAAPTSIQTAVQDLLDAIASRRHNVMTSHPPPSRDNACTPDNSSQQEPYLRPPSRDISEPAGRVEPAEQYAATQSVIADLLTAFADPVRPAGVDDDVGDDPALDYHEKPVHESSHKVVESRSPLPRQVPRRPPATSFISIKDITSPPPPPRARREWNASPLSAPPGKPARLQDPPPPRAVFPPINPPLRQPSTRKKWGKQVGRSRSASVSGSATSGGERFAKGNYKGDYKGAYQGDYKGDYEGDYKRGTLAVEAIEEQLAQAAKENVTPGVDSGPPSDQAWSRLEQLEERMANLVSRLDDRLEGRDTLDHTPPLPAQPTVHSPLVATSPAGLSHAELQRMADTLDDMERTQADIHARWFTTPLDLNNSPPLSPKKAELSPSPGPPSHVCHAPLVITGGDSDHDQDSMFAPPVSNRVPSISMHEAPSEDDVLSSDDVAAVMAEREEFLRRRRASDSVLAAAGGRIDQSGVEKFNPVAIVEAVTDAVIDDVVQEHVEEMLNVCDHYAEVMFAEEFATPG